MSTVKYSTGIDAIGKRQPTKKYLMQKQSTSCEDQLNYSVVTGQPIGKLVSTTYHRMEYMVIIGMTVCGYL
jgi:hypothetical protein